MKCDATRILWSQRWLEGQGTCLRQVLVQIYLKRPDSAEITTRWGAARIDLTLQIAFIEVMRMSNVREKSRLSGEFSQHVHICDDPFA